MTEKEKQQKHNYYIQHRDERQYTEKDRQQKHDYYIRHRDERLAKQKAYWEKHKTEIAKRQHDKLINDPEYHALVKQRAKHKRCQNQEDGKAYILSYKQTHPCVDCGETDTDFLCFHHLRDKRYGITYMCVKGSFPLETIKAEIDKCEVLCMHCHIKRHKKEGLTSRHI